MTGREIRDFLLPWTGLAVGVVTVATVHQFGAYGTFDHCRPISPVPITPTVLPKNSTPTGRVKPPFGTTFS